MKANQIVEAVLFSSDAPLKAEEIARADESLNEDSVEAAVQELRALYDASERAWQIEEVAEGYQLLTRPEFAGYLERFDTVPRPSRLSGPALESLAIIAYRQPIGRVEIEYIRGVSSSGVIRSLQDRALVDVVGRGEGLGRPLLYGTTKRFLEHFGFSSLDDLPRPEELPIVLRDRVPLLEEEEEDDGQLSLEEVESGDAAQTSDGAEGSDADASEGEPEGSPPGDPAEAAEAETVGGDTPEMAEAREDADDDEAARAEDAEEDAHLEDVGGSTAPAPSEESAPAVEEPQVDTGTFADVWDEPEAAPPAEEAEPRGEG